ncbi:MAG: hypothetical protein EAX96_16185 [Candidatus Lokiarchaeota archaeon]|nr:hypothetical protein [Candidatus Lokiarchaeota archaeon]
MKPSLIGVKILDKIEKLYQDEKYLAAAREYGLIAEEYERKGQYKELIETAHKIINCYLKYSDKQLEEENFFDAAQKQIEAANMYNEFEEFENAKELIKEALKNLDKAGSIALKNQNFQIAGDIFSQGAGYSEVYLDKSITNQFYEKAIEAYQKAADEFEDTEYYKNYVRLLQFVAIMKEKLSKYDDAIIIHEKIIEISKKRTFSSIATESYLHIYECLMQQDKQDKALKFLKEGANFNIKEAELSLDIDDLINAISTYENTLKILKVLDDKKGIIEVSQKLADIYLEISNSYEDSNLDNTARYLRNAALIYKSLEDKKYQEEAAKLFEKVGRILFELGDNKEAAENYMESSSIYKEIGEFKKAADVSISATESAKMSNCKLTTVESLRNALEHLTDIQDETRIKLVVHEISKCLKDLSIEEENDQNYHVSASLLYELGTYLENIDDSSYEQIYEDSSIKYIKAADQAIEDNQEVIASYSLVCGVLLNIVINKMDLAKNIIEKYEKNSKIKNQKYFALANLVLNSTIEGKTDFNAITDQFKPLILNSVEISELFNKIKDLYS